MLRSQPVFLKGHTKVRRNLKYCYTIFFKPYLLNRLIYANTGDMLLLIKMLIVEIVTSREKVYIVYML